MCYLDMPEEEPKPRVVVDIATLRAAQLKAASASPESISLDDIKQAMREVQEQPPTPPFPPLWAQLREVIPPLTVDQYRQRLLTTLVPPDLDWLWRDLSASKEEHLERYVDSWLEAKP